MRILHLPKNVAGQASAISRGQRQLGHVSDVLVLQQNAYNYPVDRNLDVNSLSPPKRVAVKVITFLQCIRDYDCFHYHGGVSLFPKNLDMLILRGLGKKVVMEYWGSEVIQRDIAVKETLLDIDTLDNMISKEESDERRRSKLRWISKISNHTIVGDFSLLPYSKDSIVVRQAFDLRPIKFIGCAPKHTVKIAHAPTNREIKGTKYVIDAIESLKKSGYPIEFVLIENTPHDELIRMLSDVDIIIDDVRQGPYGILAIEGMALGKVVMARMKESLIGYYEGIPLINTDPSNIVDNLKKIIADPDLRVSLGKKGREYVEKNHDAIVIGEKLVTIYQQ